MTKEQLAEREFPDHVHFWHNDAIHEKRAAFIKGLEHSPDFLNWLIKNQFASYPDGSWANGDEDAADSHELFELFLTEKYGNEQQV